MTDTLTPRTPPGPTPSGGVPGVPAVQTADRPTGAQPAGAHPVGLTAHARLTAELAPGPYGPRTVLPELRGDGPLALRRTRGEGAAARVTVVGAMSAPLGGDRLALSAAVRPHARLRVDSAAATIALPGRTGLPAHYRVSLDVAEDAELDWSPEPLIAAHRSDLRASTRIRLAPGARLRFREEQVLGRTGEPPGTLLTRLTVHLADRPLLDQELHCGPGAEAGWDGPAVLAGHRALGQLLLVAPGLTDRPLPPRTTLGPTATATALAGGPAVLITALAPDAGALRAVLNSAAAHLTW